MSSHKVFRVLGVILALSAIAWVQPTISHAGLIAHYSFDNVDDLGADVSGNDYRGVVVGDVTSAAGKSGGAAKFGAAVGNYLGLPVGDIMSDGNIPTSNFTLAVWSKVADPATTQYAIFNARAADNTFVIHPEIRSTYYRFLLRDNGSVQIGELKKTATPIFDEWRHIAMTWDRDTKTMAVYINGDLWDIKSDCVDRNMAADWDKGARIGLNIDNARQYVGLMDEMYLFNETLSKEQIGALASVPEPSSLVLAFGAVFSALLLRWKWNG
jgi:hypothetical protein